MPNANFPLTILAGPDAIEELSDAGLRPERVRAFVGASGGPKWLALQGLDLAVMPWLRAAQRPLHAVGSSIGSWRSACLACDDPAAAIERLTEGYVEQRYVGRPAPQVVSAEANRMLEAALIKDSYAALANHSQVHLHLVTSRFRHLGAREDGWQKAALAAAFTANAIWRPALGAFVERVVFDAAAPSDPFAPWRTLPTRHVRLTAENLMPALQSSAAIPLVMSGVQSPAGSPAGLYRDGGVADYHFGREIDVDDGLTLYPHFYPFMIAGWFDKSWPWRRTTGLGRVVLIAPSPSFIQQLPNGRIPDRKDFESSSDSTRISNWRKVLALGQQLGDAFNELTCRRSLGELIEPLP